MDTAYISKDYGLINAFPDRDGSDENSPLFTIQHLLKKHDQGLDDNLDKFILACKTRHMGLFNQMPDLAGLGRDRVMSPDQLIAFVAYFKLKNRQLMIDMVWKYLKKHKFTYDNLTGKTNFNRVMQPMAIAFVGACAGSKFWRGVLVLACIVSCMAPDRITSGKLKAWTCLKALGMKKTYYICELFTNFTDAFEIYFNTSFDRPDHPNLI